MAGLALAALVLLATALTSTSGAAISIETDKLLVCYYGTWSAYRNGDGKHTVDDINPHLCTHLMYGFTGLRGNKLVSLDPYLDLPENWGKGNVVAFNNLKKVNPKLKTIAAIGGWNEGSTKYSAMASTPEGRAEFIESAVTFLLKYGFDGLDMDWEYPASRGGVKEDYVNYISLLKELREAFKQENLILTAAVSAGYPTMIEGYDIPEMNKYLDIINIMAYDYFGAWNNYTQHNAPLKSHPKAEGNYTLFDVEDSVDLWIKYGADPKKMTLGMPLYGRGYHLKDPNNHGLYALTSGPCAAGPYTREAGFLGYNEICQKQKDLSVSFTKYFDETIQAPYATMLSNGGMDWIAYDDVHSLSLKVDVIKKKGLAGGMVWSIETDDYRDKCGDGQYPLLTSIATLLNNGTNPSPSTTTTSTTTTTTTQASTTTTVFGQTTTTKAGSGSGCLVCDDTFPCAGAGIFDLGDCCISYCTCNSAFGGGYTRTESSCGNGLVFNPTGKYCDWSYNVVGCNKYN